MPTDPEREVRRKVGARVRLTRYAIWGRGSGTRQRCLDEMGLTKSKLDRWECGESEPSALFIVELHAKHDVTADWIFLGDGRRLPGELIARINAIRPKSIGN